MNIPSSEYQIQKTAEGLSVSFKESFEATKVRITPPDGVSIEQLELWGSVPEQQQGSIKKVMEQDFESDSQNIGSWVNAEINLVTDEKYEGNQSLKVSNRTADWSAATLSIGSLLGFDNITAEYTFSCYIKSGNGNMNMQVKICDSSGTDQNEATGSTVAVNDSGWTYFEYKFKMLNNSYQTLKIQTTGSNKNDYYMDNIKITKPTPPCSCNLSSPQITNSPHINILENEGNKTITLQSSVTKRNCEIDGHNDEVVQYTYSLVGETNTGAVLIGNQLKVEKSGSVALKVTATVNGLIRTSYKAFEVVKEGNVNET